MIISLEEEQKGWSVQHLFDGFLWDVFTSPIILFQKRVLPWLAIERYNALGGIGSF